MRLPQRGYRKPQWGNAKGLYDLCDNPEHELAESLVIEFNDISGIEVEVYVRDSKLEDYDKLYGEDNDYGLKDPLTTKLIYDVGDEPQVWDVFGVYGTDNIVCHIPQGTWRRDISQTVIPTIGDVIKIKWLDRLFEVSMVDDDDKVFQLSKLIWILILKPFRHSEQSDSVNAITNSPAVSAFGENEWIEEQSDAIDDYDDVDTKIYGY